MKPFIAIFLTASFFISCAGQQQPTTADGYFSTESLEFRVDTLATGLQNPWGMEFLPDGRILIVERPGRMRIFENGELLSQEVEGLPPVWSHGQGGLLDVVLHPDYDENGWIYIAYARQGDSGGNTAISRGRLQGNEFVDQELLFHGQPHTGAGHHFGCRIVFDENNYLFTTIGDRGQMNNAQDLSNHNGKVLRINDDGSIPDDNPFIAQSNAMDEIWSYGHRNIQGMGRHPQTGELWSHEHGAQGGDEINLILKGENFGWPLVTHGINYDGSQITPDTTLPGMVDPILHWTPSIAPCGLAFVDSEMFEPWQHNMLVGALAGQHIQRVVFEGNEVVHTEKILEGFARFRDVRQGPDGYIYVLTENPGLFFRLVPRQ